LTTRLTWFTPSGASTGLIFIWLTATVMTGMPSGALMRMRSAASSGQPLQEIVAPRDALIGPAGRPVGTLTYNTMML
jgi:hypothetical protein